MTEIISKKKFESRVEFNEAEVVALKKLKEVFSEAPLEYWAKRALLKVIQNVEEIKE